MYLSRNLINFIVNILRVKHKKSKTYKVIKVTSREIDFIKIPVK